MAAPEAGALVAAEGIHVFLGGLPILKDVSLRVHACEAVAILGPNGSGKTTLLRTLVALTPFQQGSLELFGTPIRWFRDWHRIGYVPQHATLNVQNATVREVVTSGRLAHRGAFRWFTRADRAIVAEALDRVGLADRARWPFAPLSGGQKQRVLIARALATRPDLLVMDEPLAGVDLEGQAVLARLLGEFRDDGLGVVLVLHELEAMAGVLDRIVQLRDGRVVPHADGLTQSPRARPSASSPSGLGDPGDSNP